MGAITLTEAMGRASMHSRIAPLVAANDPLPGETVLTAHALCNAAGDFLMRASSLCSAMHSPVPLDRFTAALTIMEREAKAMRLACQRIGATIAALQAKAGEQEALS